MISEAEALSKALSIGSLEYGEALQVEDLEVTLKCVTYYMPPWEYEKNVRRFIRTLKKRNIYFRVREVFKETLNQWMIPRHRVYIYTKYRKFEYAIWEGLR